MDIKLEKLNIEKSSKIKVSYEKGFSRISKYLDILVVKYDGKYGLGSLGNDDAAFMCGKAAFGIEVEDPSAVILDLTKIQYEWGDQLEMLFSIGGDKPFALIVGKWCKDAIGTLVHGIGSDESPTTIDWIFDNLEDAWNYLENELEKKSINSTPNNE